MALRKIHLYGKLGKLFGKKWELDVESVGEALKAINANTNGKLEEYLFTGNGAKKYYRVSVKKKNNPITKEEINTQFGNGDIYIAPVLRGSGDNGVLQAIVGVVLIVVGVIFDRSGTLIKLGISLALGGIAQMLAPNPKSENTERNSSYLFQGSATAMNQGGSVGTVYGRALVNPMPISISVNNLDQSSYYGGIYGS